MGIDVRNFAAVLSLAAALASESGAAGISESTYLRMAAMRCAPVVDGVISDGNGGYTQSTVEVTPEQYWSAIASSSGNLGIGEANLYSATNIRLRNLSLNYAFPKAMLKNTPFQQVKLGVSCNNVWMIKSNMNGVDPESVFATSTNATGFENAASPTSRTFLFNVTLGF